MSSMPTPMRDWRQNITVEISVKPLPPASRFRARIDVMVARLRNLIRDIT